MRLSLKMPKFSLRVSRSQLTAVNLFLALERTLWGVFLLFLFATTLFSSAEPTVGLVIWFYTGVLTLLALQVIKRILLKGEHLPAVPYDVLVLTLTTFVAIALFISTLRAQTAFSVWGSGSLALYSSVSIIAFWFLYYLTIANFRNHERMTKFMSIVAWMPVVGLLVNLLQGDKLFAGFTVLGILLLPAWGALLVYSPRKIYLFNLLGGVYLLLTTRSAFALATVLIVSLVMVGVKLYGMRTSLRQDFAKFAAELKSVFADKLSLSHTVSNNAQVSFLLLALTAIVVAALRLLVQFDNNIFENFASGFKLFVESFSALGTNQKILTVLFGNGLVANSQTYFSQFLHSYGLINLVIFSILLVLLLRAQYKLFAEKLTAEQKGSVAFVFMSLVTMIVFFLFAQADPLMIVSFWVLLAFAGVQSMVLLAKKDYLYAAETLPYDRKVLIGKFVVNKLFRALWVITTLGLLVYVYTLLDEVALLIA